MKNQKLDLTDYPVDISQVENGFRLKVNPNPCSGSNSDYVFQSKAELFSFLSEHFSFENKSRIKNDIIEADCAKTTIPPPSRNS